MLQQYYKAFKAYDIRGIFGSEIDTKFAYLLGRAIGKFLLQKYETPSFLLASDVRSQNTELISHFLGGMQKVGVVHITLANLESKGFPYGICSTPTLYYLAQNDFDLAVSVTASHNPGAYVGMKFADRKVELMSTEVLKELFEKEYVSEAYHQTFPLFVPQESTFITNKIKKLTDFLMMKRARLTKRYTFVVDFSNGAGVTFEKQFFEQLTDKHTIIFINDSPDGTFSAHESDTSVNDNYTQLVQTVQERGADFGVMFDGDADRIGLVSNTGAIIRGDTITAIIAKGLLEHEKGEIFYDVMSTKAIEKIANQYGGTARRTRTGRYFINRELNERGGLFAGEVSGHYMFREMGGYEMPLLAMVYVLEALAAYADFDTMVQAFQSSFKTPITSINVEDKERVLATIKEMFADYQQDFLDGISVYGNDFWLNVRGSNTENKVRYTVEADSLEKMEEIQATLASIFSL